MINIPTQPTGSFGPIWIDKTYTFTGSSAYTYVIGDASNNILFSGKAYAFPGTTTAEINVNKICENYLENDLTILSSSASTGITTQTNAAQTFKLYRDTDRITTGSTLLNSYKFYWNYNQSNVIYSGVLSEPINGHYDVNMKKLRTSLDNTNGVQTEWNSQNSSALGYTTSACGDYALYYLNRNGGWDSFLIEGKVIENDSYSTSSFETKSNQVNYWSRENNRYRNEITHTWELSTNWLSDSESRRLAFHLLSSNKVYLHNLTTNEITPVDITDTSTDYKTFKNERKLISYKIKIKESNKQVIL